MKRWLDVLSGARNHLCFVQVFVRSRCLRACHSVLVSYVSCSRLVPVVLVAQVVARAMRRVHFKCRLCARRLVLLLLHVRIRVPLVMVGRYVLALIFRLLGFLARIAGELNRSRGVEHLLGGSRVRSVATFLGSVLRDPREDARLREVALLLGGV